MYSLSEQDSNDLLGTVYLQFYVRMYFSTIVYNYFCRKREDTNTNTTSQLNCDKVQEPYEIIPEHTITQNSQSSSWLPSQSASSAEIPDVEAYEEVGEHNRTNDPENVRRYQNDTNLTEAVLSQRYLNVPVTMSEEREEESGEYEDVPDGKAYEPLKNVNYENTKNMENIKVYTKLENNRRDSQV